MAIDPNLIPDPEVRTWYEMHEASHQDESARSKFKLKQAKNALILGYDHEALYTMSCSHHLAKINKLNVYALAIAFDEQCVRSNKDSDNVKSVLVNNVIINENQIDYIALDDILNNHKIDLVFQHASFRRCSIKIAEFIESRNFFIKKYGIPGNLIDIFYFEGGFLRPDLHQLNNVGWNAWSSFTYDTFPNLNTEQKNHLNIWIEQFKEIHLTKTVSKDDIMKKYGIEKNKKIILCALQKPWDSVIRHFAHRYCSTIEFAEACMNMFNSSEYHLLIRQHPLDDTNFLSFNLLKAAASTNVTFLPKNDDISVYDYINISDAVCVVNSTVGCEALALGKPVVHFGNCIYQHYSIPCNNSKPETIENVKKQIDQFAHNKDQKDRIDRLLYAIITNSPGRRGLSFKDIVNKLSKYNVII